LIATYLLIYYKKKRKSFHGIKELLEGNVERFDSDLPLDQQTELLPYDKTHWEIPRQHIKLGIQLGVGQFGRVVKAQFSDSQKGDDEKTVAVKMVRSRANVSAMEALVSEMKIMSYLGSHLNVVNLIGACTKDISQGKTLQIDF
jgi:serine/threonine protein kinase